MSFTRYASFAMAFVVAGCSERGTPVLPTEAPRAALAQSQLSGALLGPTGNNICNDLAAGARLRIWAIDRSQTPDAGKTQRIDCPDNTFAMTVREGADYVMRVMPLGAPGPLPLTFVEPSPFAVSGPTIHNVQQTAVRLLSGNAKLNGNPIADVPLLIRTPLTDFMSGDILTALSGADGLWYEGPRRVTLARGLPYDFFCLPLLGTRPVQQNSNTTDYPAAGGAATCRLADALALNYSHSATRMVVTSYVGALGSEAYADQDRGWGVQYVAPPATGPSHSLYASELPLGGFLLEVNGRVMSTYSAENHGFCGGCSDVGYEAGPAVGNPGGVKRVTWTLNDADAGTPVGLTMQQVSYDGTGGDYVLFDLRFTNTSAAEYDLNVGMVYDWDVVGVVDNVGATAMDGRLAYVTNEFGQLFIGTLFLGTYGHTTTFIRPLNSPAFTPAEQLALLRGEMTQTSAGPADLTAFQSAGPLRIRAGRVAHAWFAIVGGTTLAEMQTNANAAAADYMARTGAPSAFRTTDVTVPGVTGLKGAAMCKSPECGKRSAR